MFSINCKMISYLTIIFLILIENVNAGRGCDEECDNGCCIPLWGLFLIIIGAAVLSCFLVLCVCLFIRKMCDFVKSKTDEIKNMYIEENLIRDETKTPNIGNEGNSMDLVLPSNEHDLSNTNKITITINNEEYEATLKRKNPKTSDKRFVEMEA